MNRALLWLFNDHTADFEDDFNTGDVLLQTEPFKVRVKHPELSVRIYLSPISKFSHLSQIGYPKGHAIIFVQMHDQRLRQCSEELKTLFPKQMF